MRLFVAAELPEEEKRRMDGLRVRREWFGNGEGFRKVAVQNLHLTLKFLGEVAEARAARVREALAAVEWPASLSLHTEAVTFFPPRGPVNVFVARLGGGDAGRLRQLHADVESALEPLGFAREAREFKPHVTLMRADHRRKPPHPVRERVRESPPAAGEPFVIRSFVLFQSHLKPGGPEYIALARFGD